MMTTWAGVVFVGSLILALVIVYRPFGDYMARVLTTTRHLRAERVIYRVGGIDPDAEQGWGRYLRSVLAFSAVSISLPVRIVASAARFRSPVRRPANDRQPGLEHRGQLRHQYELAELLRRERSRLRSANGRPGRAELRLGRGGGGRGYRAWSSGFARSQTDRVGNFWST
jgi:K+-transporting ATPase ATPase A chain